MMDEINVKPPQTVAIVSSASPTAQIQGDSKDNLTDPLHGDGCDPPGSEPTPSRQIIPARSQVLEDDRILSLTFSFFLRSGNSRDINSDSENFLNERNQELLWVSLVCKKFFNPAMKFLWHSMKSWVPLVKLINHVVEQEKGKLSMKDAISEEDLERYDFYAALVKRFEYSFDNTLSCPQIPQLAILSVSQFRPLGLFPSLQTLIFTEFEGAAPAEDTVFLFSIVPTSTLSKVSIRGVAFTNEILAVSLLQNIQLKSPMLSSLTLEGFYRLPTFRRIHNFANLKELDLDLKTLNLSFFQTVFKGSFGALETLRMVGYVSLLQILVDALFYDTPNLKSLIISVVPGNTLTSMPVQRYYLNKLLTSFMARQGMSFNSITVTSQCHNIHIQLPQNPPGLFRHFDVPSCNQLQRLSIPLDILMSYSLLPASNALRMLEQLELRGGIRETDRYSLLGMVKPHNNGPWKKTPLSISNLTLFLDSCPNLKVLSIPISLFLGPVQIENMQSAMRKSLRCHPLNHITLQAFAAPGVAGPSMGSLVYKYDYPLMFHPTTNSFSELFLVARFIDHIFPHLQDINTQALRLFVDKQWLDGLEAGTKEFRELRVSKGDSHACRNTIT